MKKIILIDDHTVILEGLSLLLPKIYPCKIVGRAVSGEKGVELAKIQNPDIIFMDLVMPGGWSGIESIEKIRMFDKNVKIICLTMLTDAHSIHNAIKAGANGYLIKNASAEDMKLCMECISGNEIYIHPELIEFFVMGWKNQKIARKMILNDLDFEILSDISKGLTTDDIAGKVFRSPETIRSRRKMLLKKFNCSNSAELVAYALRNNLLI